MWDGPKLSQIQIPAIKQCHRDSCQCQQTEKFWSALQANGFQLPTVGSVQSNPEETSNSNLNFLCNYKYLIDVYVYSTFHLRISS